MSGDILIFCFRTEKTSLELRGSHLYIESVFSGKNFLSSQFFLLMFCFLFFMPYHDRQENGQRVGDYVARYVAG